MAPTLLPNIISLPKIPTGTDGNPHPHRFNSRGLGPSQGSSTGMIIGFSVLGIVIFLAGWLCVKCLSLPPLPAADDDDVEQTAAAGEETNEKKEGEEGGAAAAEGAGDAAAGEG